MNTAPLLAKIAAKRAELAKLDRQRETLRIEIKTYEDAARIVGLTPDEATVATVTHERKQRGPGQKRARGFSPMWANILTRMSDPYRQEFGYDDILAVGRELGYAIKRNVARSQMKLYTDAGYVERVASGRYTVTELGGEAADTSDKEEAPPREGGAPDSTAEEATSARELFGTTPPPTPGRDPG